MTDNHKDVLIAAYLFEDLARKDFDAIVDLAEQKTITVEGVVLVQKDTDGEVHVTETGDHLGRKGVKLGGGVGLAVGLVAPPLLAATAVGAAAGGVVGKFAKHRLESGIGEKMGSCEPFSGPVGGCRAERACFSSNSVTCTAKRLATKRLAAGHHALPFQPRDKTSPLGCLPVI